MDKIFQGLKRIFQSRSLKYGSNSVILVAAIIAIAVFVNILVGMTTIKWDLTPNKLFSISDTTKEILSNLDKDVTIYGLFDETKISSGNEYKEVTELLGLYEKYPRIKVEYVDPERNPGFIKEKDPDNLSDLGGNDFIVESGNKIKKLEYYDLFQVEMDQQTFQQYKTGSIAEQGFTGAIKYVTADETPTIYFTEGHEENSIDGDYEIVKDYLERNNYDIKTINLFTEAAVPEDAELLIVASPKRDISADEKDRIEEYLGDGGKAIFMLDSLETDPSFNELNDLLEKYNVSINNDKIKENDPNRHVPNDPYVILLDVERNMVVEEDFNMILANSRSVNILKNQKEYITVTSLLKTSDKAEGEQINTTSEDDIKGPLNVAVAVEYNGGMKPVKILVMGNADFISDNAQSQYGTYFNTNIYFFLSSLNWMLDKKDETIIAPKNYDTPRLEINAMQANMTGLFLVILLPIIILGAGLLVYLRRRHL